MSLACLACNFLSYMLLSYNAEINLYGAQVQKIWVASKMKSSLHVSATTRSCRTEWHHLRHPPASFFWLCTLQEPVR